MDKGEFKSGKAYQQSLFVHLYSYICLYVIQI